MTAHLPIEKPVVLIRKYTNADRQLVSYSQCKVIEVNGEWVAFRDIYPNKSQLFRDKTWNLDHLVYEWLKIHGVEKIYYFDHKTGKLFKTTLTKIKNSLKRNEAYKEKLNNHTQYFLPRFLFSEVYGETKNQILKEARRWIKSEVDVSWMGNTFDKLEEREPSIFINYEVKKRLMEIWRNKYA